VGNEHGPLCTREAKNIVLDSFLGLSIRVHGQNGHFWKNRIFSQKLKNF
jgi:hypothetical protein